MANIPIAVVVLSMALQCVTLELRNNATLDDNLQACGQNGICDCHNSTVDCADLNLPYLPDGVPRNTSYLYLERNIISWVPPNWFLQFENLLTLNLADNELSEPFELPASLKYLNVSRNEIYSIDGFFKEGCKALEHVDFTENKVTNIKEGLFSRGCSNLTWLFMLRNYLTSVTNQTFQGLSGLTRIELSYGSSNEIEVGAFRDVCKNAESVTFRYFLQPIVIPEGLFRVCHHLESIYLKFSQFTEILPGTYSGLKSVRSVTIMANEFISKLPETLFDSIGSIFRLNLSHLNLTEIPENLLKNVHNVSKVTFGYNRIKEIPRNLFSRNIHCTYLLIMSYNEITYIPDGFFRNLPQLKELYLDNNNIVNIDSETFLGTQISQMYLHQNRVSRIEDRPFVTRTEKTLRHLDLRDNPLLSVTSDSLLDLLPNANVTLSCENLTLPRKIEDINLVCVTSNVQIIIHDVDELAIYPFWFGGFDCNRPEKICKACPVGYYGNMVDKGCISCPAGGFYQDVVAAVSSENGEIGCKTCNPGTFVEGGYGGSPLSCTVCPEGTDKSKHAGFRACFCLENYYRVARFGKCMPCPQAGIKCSGDFATIKPDYFWKWNSSDLNIYRQFVTNIQITNNSYDRKTSVYTGPLPKAHKCPAEERCINNDSNLEGNCVKGYEGWMCTVCEEGYSKLFGNCHRCNSMGWIGIVLLLILVLVLIAYLLIPCIKDTLRKEGVRSFIKRMKIVVDFCQVVTSYWNTMNDLPFLQTVFFGIVKTLTLSLSSILHSPSCYFPWFRWNPYTELWVLYCYLFCVICLIIICYIIKSAKRICKSRDSISDKKACLELIMFFIFLNYAEICKVVFQIFNCDKFDLYLNDTHPEERLHSYYDIECATDKHKRMKIWTIFGWVLIGFPFVIPLFHFLCGTRSANLTQEGSNQTTRTENWIADSVSFLFENYKENWRYWEFLELFRKMVLTALPVFFDWKGIVAFIGLFLFTMFIGGCCYAQPWKKTQENSLQLFALLLLYANMLASAIPLPENCEDILRGYVIFIANMILPSIPFLDLIIRRLIVTMCVPSFFRCGDDTSRSAALEDASPLNQDQVKMEPLIPKDEVNSDEEISGGISESPGCSMDDEVREETNL